jgi:hypothetical protein
MPFRVARTACVIGAVSSLLAGSPRAARAAAPNTIIARLVALPLSDRASLLVELKKPVPLARETKSDAQSVIVEAGPIDGAVQALDLTPAGTTPLLGTVSVASVTAPNGQAFLRITVQLRAPASHRVRLAGSRIYVDLAPLPSRVRPGDLEAAAERHPGPSSPLPPPTAAAVGGPASSPPAGATAAPATGSPSGRSSTGPIAAMSDEAIDAAYLELQSDVSKRAAALAPRADVKGLLALVDDTKHRDERLGQKRPELVAKILEQVNRRLDEARLYRLEMDAAAFEKQGQRPADAPR